MEKIWTFLDWYLLSCFIFIMFNGCTGISEKFTTQLCPGTMGPSHGEVLRFDPNSKQDTYVTPSATLDCWVTFRGMPDQAGSPKRYTTLTWRTDNYTMRGTGYGTGAGNTAGSGSTVCDTAYIEVYDATDAGEHIPPPALGPICGTTPPDDFTTASQSIVVHIYVAVASTSSTTSNNTAVVTSAPTNTNSTTVTDTTSGGPFVNFTADFTSYFVGSCNSDGTENDADQLQCNNGRCIDMSLRCDIYFSNNCGDGGDVSSGPPGNCTFPPEEDIGSTLLPLWIVLGLLVAALLSYWCCWRPGWCPWRCARLRNVTCCRSCCKPCLRAACCRSNGCCGPCSGGCRGCATRCCVRTNSGFPEKKPEDAASEPPPSKESKTAEGWLNFAYDDGVHVREIR